jgi:hypothetical protein
LLFDTGSLVAELLEPPAFLLSLPVAAWNTGLLLRADETPPEEVRPAAMPGFGFVLLLTLMLLPGAESLAALVLALICTEPFAVDKFDMLETGVVASLLLKALRDCAGMLVCAALGALMAWLAATLLRGDTTVTLLLDRFVLADTLATLPLDTLVLGIDLAALLTEELGLDIVLLLTGL